MTHYDMEDTPPNDADTQVALYEQAYEVVADSQVRAKKLFEEAEPMLQEIFDKAEKTGDERTLVLVNDTYERVQNLMAVIGHQGAALRGANAAIPVLKEHRDEVMKELKTLLDAMDAYDEDAHPKLFEFTEMVREWEHEYWWEYFHNVQMEAIEEMQETNVKTVLKQYLHFDSNVDLVHATKCLCRILNDDRAPTEEQKQILQQLVDSFIREEYPERVLTTPPPNPLPVDGEGA